MTFKCQTLLVFCCLLFVSPAAAQTSNECCELAVKAYRAGDVSKARDLLLLALEKNPAKDQQRVNILDNLRLMYEKLEDVENEAIARQAYRELDEKVNPRTPVSARVEGYEKRRAVKGREDDDSDRPVRSLRSVSDDDGEPSANVFGFMDITSLVSGGVEVSSGGKITGNVINKSNYYFMNVIISVELTTNSGVLETDTISIDGLPPNASKEIIDTATNRSAVSARILRISGKRVQ